MAKPISSGGVQNDRSAPTDLAIRGLKGHREKGVAILMALVFLLIMTYISMEVTRDTSTEYLSAVNEINSVKAYYAAKAGVDMSLLRIKIFQQVEASGVRKQLGPMGSMLDMIWNFPFIWPPDSLLPASASAVDKSSLKDVVKESKMDATFQASITAEGSKIDINDLGSPAKALSDIAFTQLRQIWRTKMENDEEFGKQFRDFRFDEVLNNLADWVDFDTNGRNGSDERNLYEDFKSQNIPPNEPFKTMEELHLVSGMTDEFYDFLVTHITIYGSKAINVNQANKDTLMAIDPGIDERIADEIIENRSNPSIGPFSDDKAFETYLQNNARINVQQQKPKWPPLTFEGENFFRIKSRGQFGKAKREIVAIVYDFDRVKSTIAPLVVPPTPTPGAQASTPGGGATPPTPTPAATPTPAPGAGQNQQGRPGVVYWQEN